MKKFLTVFLALLLLAYLSGCSKTESAKKDTAPQPEKAQTAKAPSSKAVKALQPDQPKEYIVTGTRDPFQSFIIAKPKAVKDGVPGAALDTITLGQVQLVGVIMGSQPTALLQDSAGIGFIVKVGTHVGENAGIVTKITINSITVTQYFKDYSNKVTTREVVMSLKKEDEGDK